MTPMKFREVDKMLRKAGYYFDHANGSHYTYTHDKNGNVVVPFHGDNVELKPGTLKSVIKQMKGGK